jgi:hypothetical protein
MSSGSVQADHVPILQKGTKGENGIYCFISAGGRISATPVRGRDEAPKAFRQASHTLGRITVMNCDKAEELYHGEVEKEAIRNGCIILHGASEDYSDHSRIEAVQPRFIQIMYLLLKEQGMHPKYWPYACHQAEAIWNNTHRPSINAIPNEYEGITPTRLHLQPDFGQLVYARRTAHTRKKSDRTSDSVVLGWCMGQAPRATPNVLNVMDIRTGRIHDYGNCVPVHGIYYKHRKRKTNEEAILKIEEFISAGSIDEQLLKLDTIVNNGNSKITDSQKKYIDPREKKRREEVNDLLEVLKQQTVEDNRDPDDHDYLPDGEVHNTKHGGVEENNFEDEHSTQHGGVDENIEEDCVEALSSDDADDDTPRRSKRHVKNPIKSYKDIRRNDDNQVRKIKKNSSSTRGYNNNLKNSNLKEKWMETITYNYNVPCPKILRNKDNPRTIIGNEITENLVRLWDLGDTKPEPIKWTPEELARYKEPKTVAAALKDKYAIHWQWAIIEELKSLIKKDAFEAVNVDDIPNLENILSTRIVLTLKRSEKIPRFKCRIVIRGFEQVQLDNENNYAAPGSLLTLYLLLAQAVERDLHVATLDVKTAFLNAKAERPFWFNIEAGLDIPPGHVLKGKASIYGLRSSPRAFSKLANEACRKLGFSQCIVEPSLWYKPTGIDGKTPIYLIRHVDDFAFASSRENNDHIQQEILAEFNNEGTYDPNPKTYLGMQLEISKDNIRIHQEAQIEKVILKYNIDTTKKPRSPYQPSLKVDDVAETYGIDMQILEKYRSLHASLAYVCQNTRPDCRFIHKELSRYLTRPNQKLYEMVERLAQYLYHTKGDGLIFSKQDMNRVLKEHDLVAHSDASLGDVRFVNNKKTRKSSFGYCIKYKGCTIHAKSSTITDVVWSTTEAEYLAGSEAARKLKHVTNILKFLNIKFQTPILKMDNQSAIHISNDETSINRTKHLDMRYHFIRQAVQEYRQLKLEYVRSNKNMSDTFTKMTPEADFTRMKNQLLSTYDDPTDEEIWR